MLVKAKKNCTVHTTKYSLLPTRIMIRQISAYLDLVIMHGCIMIVQISTYLNLNLALSAVECFPFLRQNHSASNLGGGVQKLEKWVTLLIYCIAAMP